MISSDKIKKQTLMARQPIVNDNKITVAYELLYRSDSNDNRAFFDFCGSEATINVLLNSITSIYKNKELKCIPAFINLTSDLLVNNTLPKLSTSKIVLEILEDVEVTDNLISAVKDLRSKNYTIALDDFIYADKFIPLLKLCQIVKVDVLGMSFDDVEEQVRFLEPYKLTLLAEKIETHEMFNHCKGLGFKLFQGYFLSKPEIIEGVKLETSKIHMLKIIQELENPNVDMQFIENLILQDPILTYKILLIVNSSANQLVRKIKSIEEGINLLGVSEIKKWALIIMMVSSDDKPQELIIELLARGRMCENLATERGIKDIKSYMISGIFSGMDAIFDIELQDLLEQVSLNDEIHNAIINGNGDMGEILHSSINFSKGLWDNISKDISHDMYNKSYLESLDWAKESLKLINS